MSHKNSKKNKLVINGKAIFPAPDGTKYVGTIVDIYKKPVISGRNNWKEEYVKFKIYSPGNKKFKEFELRSDFMIPISPLRISKNVNKNRRSRKLSKANVARKLLNGSSKVKRFMPKSTNSSKRKPLRISIKGKKTKSSSPLPKKMLKSNVEIKRVNNISRAAFNNNWGENPMLGDPYEPQNINFG